MTHAHIHTHTVFVEWILHYTLVESKQEQAKVCFATNECHKVLFAINSKPILLAFSINLK